MANVLLQRVEASMTRILVVTPNLAMRERIIAGLQGIDRPFVALALRTEAARLFDNIRQVLVYAVHQGDDAAWLAMEMEKHSELRVVYLSQHPWVSLNYDRARCMIAPVSPEALNTNLLQQMVLGLLAPD